MYSRSVGLAPPATHTPTPQRSGGNTTLLERMFTHMRKEVQKPTPLPNTPESFLQSLQQELYITPFLIAELVYRKLGRIYSILQRLERDTSNPSTKSLLNSVVPQLEVYIKALNINEAKGDDLSQMVALIRGVISRSKGEWYTPTDEKRTHIGWG